ncbi:MAG TPA: hypothetical protein VF532_16855 [Candidatus Angelobacter sp.]
MLLTTTLEEMEERPPLATKASSNSFGFVVEKIDVVTLDVEAVEDRKPLSPKAVASIDNAGGTDCAPALWVTTMSRKRKTDAQRASISPVGEKEAEMNFRNARGSAKRDNSTLVRMLRCNL